MELKQLPDLQFTDTDPDTLSKSVITIYEGLAGRTLAKGDPVRLFLLSLASIIVQQNVIIDTRSKQNFLAYAKNGVLDHIGWQMTTDRIAQAAATTTIKITLSAAREQITRVPAGVRVTAGDGILFALDADTIIQAGETTATQAATCTTKGASGNGYKAGELCQLVDPTPFVQSVTNTTTSEGGSDKEDDEPYRLRIHEAPEKFSTAGPDGAYEYHAKEASALVTDVSVSTPSPGCVEVRPLLEGGKIPGEELLKIVENKLSARNVRPLTDNLTVLAPETVSYNVNLKYWIDRADATDAAAIQTAVESAVDEYILWQKSKIGRDINQTELYYRLRAAGAKRAEITEPVATAISSAQVAIAAKKTVTFGGLEDG